MTVAPADATASDPHAQAGGPLDGLFPALYDELRGIARRQRRRERELTLDTTGVVHEAYLRLAAQRQASWDDRARFLAAAAATMRRVLVDHARRRHAAKRGGDTVLVSLADAGLVDQRAESLLALDEALTRLAAIDARLARVVECRFFGGLTEAETAAALGVTERTVRRDWVKARGWLHAALDGR